MPQSEPTIGDRLGALLGHLGIERCHVGGCMSGDWGELIAAPGIDVTTLTLICPMLNEGLPDGLEQLQAPTLIVTGDWGAPAARAKRLADAFANSTLVTLADYASPIWADPLADRTEEIYPAVTAVLDQSALSDAGLSAQSGEVAGLTYDIQGAGPPLLLLPLALAPSQWQPIQDRLRAHFCTITVRGPMLGMVALLEARGRSGYGRIVANLTDRAALQPGETVLEAGCGSGFLARALAERTNRANPITATDLNRFLLDEAAALARRDGLEDILSFQEANAEAMPFADNAYDMAYCCTVMEEGDADRMLAELVRVTKPGGRVVVMTRAVDMDWWANLALPEALHRKINGLGPKTGSGAGKGGSADGSLYRRMADAGLVDIQKFPQLAIYEEGERLNSVIVRLTSMLTGDEAETCRAAVAAARADGTLFVAEPFHSAVGAKL
jgi:SAM-dependent methyltransferase